MEQEFWRTRWAEGRIGFHQNKVNSRLRHLFPALVPAPGSEVFVPLCGKSLDMLWLHQQGYRVLGIELSDKAVEAFFDENALPYRRGVHGDFTRFDGTDSARGITLLAGDYFSLTPADVASMAAFYDRASLIAMPERMRVRYAQQLARLVPAACPGLLLTIDYDPAKMQGPPFPVPDAVTRSLFDADFTIEELAHASGPDKLGHLEERGLDTLDEYAYTLVRRG